MKQVFTIFFAASLFMAGHLSVEAQDDPRPYHPLAEAVAKAIQEKFPDWKRTSVPPINKNESNKFSEEVIIDQWKSDVVIVKVAILIHPSKQDAQQALKEFTAGVKASERLQDVGNDAYAWGGAESVAFRKGRYTTYISTVPIEFSEEVETIAPTDIPKKTKFSKTFAQIVAKILND